MIVVADTSPLQYLILIDQVDLLPVLFGSVLVPGAVLQELQHPKTPPKVRLWMDHRPDWLQISLVTGLDELGLAGLGRGEREAIQLALVEGVDRILMDEMEGRLEAERRHLEVHGTLGILERGAHLGLLDFRRVLATLQQTNFRLSQTVKEAFLQRHP